MAGLRGDVPMVRLKLKVSEDSNGEEETRPVNRENSEDILPPEASSSAENALGQKEDESLTSSRALAILSRLGLCRTTCLDLGISEEWYKRQKTDKQHVSVSLEVSSLPVFFNNSFSVSECHMQVLVSAGNYQVS